MSKDSQSRELQKYTADPLQLLQLTQHDHGLGAAREQLPQPRQLRGCRLTPAAFREHPQGELSPSAVPCGASSGLLGLGQAFHPLSPSEEALPAHRSNGAGWLAERGLGDRCQEQDESRPAESSDLTES